MNRKKGLAFFLVFVMLLAMAVPTSPAVSAVAAQKNDITKLGIKALPKGNTIILDSEENFFNFDPEIIQTKLGKGSTTGVVWWEVNQDTNTAGVVSSRYGYMYPVYAGSFEIRALAFTSTKTMEAWKKDKVANAKYITASTSWVTINVVSEKEGYAVARSQSQLNSALANRDCTDIVIDTDKEITFTIKPYNYTRRTLTVKAPNADVDNSGRFKQINVEEIKDNTFFERAIGNFFRFTAPNARLVVAEKAQVKNVSIASKGNVTISGATTAPVPVVVEESAAGANISAEVKVVVDVNADVIIKAAVEAIVNLLKPVKTALTGEATNVTVNVEKEAAGAEITTEVTVEVNAKADVKVEANKGAEDTVIRADEGVKVDTTNNTDKEITNTDLDGNNATTVKPGESATVTTAPEPTPDAPLVPAVPPTTPAPSPDPEPTPGDVALPTIAITTGDIHSEPVSGSAISLSVNVLDGVAQVTETEPTSGSAVTSIVLTVTIMQPEGTDTEWAIDSYTWYSADGKVSEEPTYKVTEVGNYYVDVVVSATIDGEKVTKTISSNPSTGETDTNQ